MGNYHHHQNPSAFKLDLNLISNICNLYDADGLYTIDSTQHSPLIGFAYDGFPIYGAYGYQNTNGTGPIVRMKSSYRLRSITVRNTSPTGAAVPAGPNVSAQYPVGYFREDYEFIAPTAAQPDYLDIHNGRFCVTPEYPGGTYAYFCTVDSNWNSAFPYVVGPQFYGTLTAAKVNSITEPVVQYIPATSGLSSAAERYAEVSVFPNPASDLIVVQLGGINRSDVPMKLLDLNGKTILESIIHQGSTIGFFDTRTLYDGTYLIQFPTSEEAVHRKVVIKH